MFLWVALDCRYNRPMWSFHYEEMLPQVWYLKNIFWRIAPFRVLNNWCLNMYSKQPFNFAAGPSGVKLKPWKPIFLILWPTGSRMNKLLSAKPSHERFLCFSCSFLEKRWCHTLHTTNLRIRIQLQLMGFCLCCQGDASISQIWSNHTVLMRQMIFRCLTKNLNYNP